jgi:cell division protein FtsZ
MESTFKFNMPREKSSIIKVLGVGGGGNAVNYMFSQGIKGVDFIICNTDLQVLEASPIPNKIQLGASLTNGLGAGANPEVGKQSAMEAIEDIIETLGVNTKMLFITAGMGGGTGTGAAPIIAKTARELDILTVGIVTTPFSFEGKRRKEYAAEGIEALKRSVDCLLVISNDKIKEMYGNLPMSQAFSHANEILNTAAKGIAEVITYPGEINVDFEDVKTVMKASGVALMGSSVASGESRAIDAVMSALTSPLLNDSRIFGAKNILLNLSSAPGKHELLMSEFEEISNYIQEESGFSAEMIIGTSYDDNLGDAVAVTIIATGFESGPKENKIIIGQVENKVNMPPPSAVSPVPPTPIANKVVEAPKAQEEPPTRHFLESDPVPVPVENKPNNNEIDLSMRIESEEEEVFEMEQDVFLSAKKEEPVSRQNPSLLEFHTNNPLFEDPERKIERQIQRIKELKDLNVTLNSSQGVRDLEKEPAYKRKQKKLDDVPHSSATQVSKLSLFDDGSGRTEIKSNNTFLHDNVD